MIGCSKRNRAKYPRKCVWTRQKETQIKGLIGLPTTGPSARGFWCVVSAGAACGFGIRPKICRPAAAEVSSRTQEKKTSATQGKMDTMVKWLELTSFVAIRFGSRMKIMTAIFNLHTVPKKQRNNQIPFVKLFPGVLKNAVFFLS